MSNGVSRGPFFCVARLVTSSMKQMRSSIDYIVCDLIHENKKRLQNVVLKVCKVHQSMLPKVFELRIRQRYPFHRPVFIIVCFPLNGSEGFFLLLFLCLLGLKKGGKLSLQVLCK